MMLVNLVGVVGFLGYVVSATECPHEDATLQAFSKTKQYTDGITKSSDVLIESGILLDVDLDVNSITVKGSSASLVFAENDLTVKAKGIMIKDYGQMIIGSEDCKFSHNVEIVLEGERDRDNLLDEVGGEKFIAVTDNGVLEIHGKKKLAWTKLSETVDRFAEVNAKNNGADVKYHHILSEFRNTFRWQQGLSIYIINSSLDVQSYALYDFQGSATSETKNVNRMVKNLDLIKEGDIVAISSQVYFNPRPETDFSELWNKIETVVGMEEGELLFRKTGKYDAFALVFVKVANGTETNFVQVQDKNLGKEIALATASLIYGGYKVSAVSQISSVKTSNSGIDMRILSQRVGFPEIKVVGDVSTWDVGDEILLTTTDYSPLHGEVRTIKKIDGNTITLSDELFYRHFGEIEDSVDMRGEVALLSRNIKIRGEMSHICPEVNDNCDQMKYDSHGGTVKITGDFGALFFEGAELRNMGMATDKGNYPIHFHMCGNITGKTATVQENTIRDTYSRAITVHGTFGTSQDNPGVKIIRNVAYNIFGHAYFLEDGAEIATYLEGNLGAQIKNIKSAFLFNTDKNKATVYWITNPKTIMIGNVAAGSEGMGIWYTFPLEPVGTSAVFNTYQNEEAKYTPLWQFENNIVHSCDRGGFNFDNILTTEHGDVVGCMNYEPLENPLNISSAGVKVQIVRLTAYKNRVFNTWLRGGWFEMMQYSSAESQRGVQLARGSKQQEFVKKSIFIGRSRGNFEASDYPDVPSTEKLSHYVGGMWYDGPAYISSSWFQGFHHGENGTWKAGALGFQPRNIASTSVTSTSNDLRFGFVDKVNGNRVYDDDGDATDESNLSTFDGSESASFRDGDGSVTQCTAADTVPMQLVKPQSMLLTENCKYRENWQMALCPDSYGKIRVTIPGVFTGERHDFDDASQMKRTEFADDTKTAYEDHSGEHKPDYMVLLGDSTYYYDFQFTNAFPEVVAIEGQGVENKRPIVVGICLPENVIHGVNFTLNSATPNDVFYSDSKFIFVNSFEELKADTSMRRVYQNGRMLYVKLQNRNVRNPDWDAEDTDLCSGTFCPRLGIRMLANTFTYSKCFSATNEQLNPVVAVADLPQHDCELGTKGPDADWGAGDVYQVHDGKWGEWSGWSYCCYQDGEDPASQRSTRRRNCDYPPPSAGGADCDGPGEESKDCTTPCPVDGVLSAWTIWSDCTCVGKTGTRTKTRTCSVAHGGWNCHGSLQEFSGCDVGGGCF